MVLSNAKIVLENEIVSGSLEISGGKITQIAADNVGGVDCKGLFVGPGFIDTHCHGGDNKWFFDASDKAANFHLQHGTTSILASLWRNASKKGLCNAVEKIVKTIESGKAVNLVGIHIEGPYIDKDYGSDGGRAHKIDEQEYLGLIKAAKGFIKQWTFDPVQKGSEEFAQACFDNDIKLGICYSKAAPADIERFSKYGLTIGNHIMCGSGKPATRYAGTIEVGSDEYILSNERMYAEIICDSLGAHIRHENLIIIYKCKGANRIMLVTDYCADGDTLGSDVNILGGELYGSKLTMNVACRNMQMHISTSMQEIFSMAATTPAIALGLKNVGAIKKGYAADLVICDSEFNVFGVIKNGEFVLNKLN